MDPNLPLLIAAVSGAVLGGIAVATLIPWLTRRAALRSERESWRAANRHYTAKAAER